MSELTQELSELSGQWVTNEQTVLVHLTTPAVQIVGANPLRWALWIGSVASGGGAAAPFVVSTKANMTGAAGSFIAGGTPIIISYRAVGGLVQQAWFALAVGGPVTNLQVIEVLLQQ